MSAFVRKRGQATNFWCWGKPGKSLFGQGGGGRAIRGSGNQYCLVCYTWNSISQNCLAWSFNILRSLFWAILPQSSQAPHLEVQAARLTMQGATRLFKIRGFPGGVFFFSFSLQYLSQNVADQYKYHELGNQHGDNARYVQRAFSRSVTDNCKRLKARTAFVMSNCNELLSFEREIK